MNDLPLEVKIEIIKLLSFNFYKQLRLVNQEYHDIIENTDYQKVLKLIRCLQKNPRHTHMYLFFRGVNLLCVIIMD